MSAHAIEKDSVYQPTATVVVDRGDGSSVSGEFHIEEGSVTFVLGRGEPGGTIYPIHPRIDGYRLHLLEPEQPPVFPTPGRILEPTKDETGAFVGFREVTLP